MPTRTNEILERTADDVAKCKTQQEKVVRLLEGVEELGLLALDAECEAEARRRVLENRIVTAAERKDHARDTVNRNVESLGRMHWGIRWTTALVVLPLVWPLAALVGAWQATRFIAVAIGMCLNPKAYRQ